MVLQFIECNVSFAIKYEALGTTEKAIFLMSKYLSQIIGFIASSTIVFAGHGSFEMLDQGFQLYVRGVHDGVIAHRAERIPCCFTDVAHIVPIVAHPDWRAEEVLASLALEACPYGLGYSLLRHDEIER